MNNSSLFSERVHTQFSHLVLYHCQLRVLLTPQSHCLLRQSPPSLPGHWQVPTAPFQTPRAKRSTLSPATKILPKRSGIVFFVFSSYCPHLHRTHYPLLYLIRARFTPFSIMNNKQSASSSWAPMSFSSEFLNTTSRKGRTPTTRSNVLPWKTIDSGRKVTRGSVSTPKHTLFSPLVHGTCAFIPCDLINYFINRQPVALLCRTPCCNPANVPRPRDTQRDGTLTRRASTCNTLQTIVTIKQNGPRWGVLSVFSVLGWNYDAAEGNVYIISKKKKWKYIPLSLRLTHGRFIYWDTPQRRKTR